MNHFREFLIDILRRPELLSNKFAWTVANYPNLNTATRESFYEDVRSFYPYNESNLPEIQKIQHDTGSLEDDNYKNKDFRIKNIKLSAVRGFPISEKPFGINFCKETNSEPLSTIILGANGIGKSSIFDSLEFMYCGRIGEYELRKSDDATLTDYSNDFKTFLTNSNADLSQVNCTVETVDKNIAFPNEMLPKNIRKDLIPNSFFISEYDIFSIGKLDFKVSDEKSIHYFIADSLGLKEYLDFLKMLNLFERYNRVKESRLLSSLNREIDTLNTNIEKWNTEISNRIEQEFQAKQNPSSITPSEDKIKDQILFITELLEVSFTVKAENNVYNNYLRFQEAYKELKQISISKEEENNAEFLELGLSLLEHSDDCPFCNDSNKSKAELTEYVNNRIESVKAFSERRTVLLNNFNDYNNAMDGLRTNLTIAISEIQRENNSQLATIPEALELIRANETFSKQISDYLGNLIRFSTDKKQFTLIEADKLYNSFVENESVFKVSNDKLSENFSEYYEKRGNILNNALIILNKKISSQSQSHLKLLGAIESEINRFNFEKHNAETRLKAAIAERVDAKLNLDIYQSIKQESIAYKNIVKAEIDKKISEVFDPIKDVVESILNEFNLNDGYTVEVGKGYEIDEDTGEIISEFIKIFAKSGSGEHDIKRYLNAFRYKLFCLTLGFSVAIANRRKNNLNTNIPFVIDDIFHSSDFEKRLLVEEFIGNFYDLYNKYCPSMPIQLILFTHDELIFTCILNKLTEKGLLNETIFGRLIAQYDAIELPNYKDILYKIPEDIPDLIAFNVNELLSQ